MKRFLTTSLFLSLVFISFKAAHASECKVTILHFNDLHGYLATPKKGLGGAARIASLIGKIEKANDKEGRYTVLLNGGDIISGTLVSEYYKGEAEFEFMKAIGTEAFVIGNHEFDFGQEALKKNIKRVDFPVLGANIIDTRTERNFATASFVLPLNPGCKVGILGLTASSTPGLSLSKNVEGLVFKDEIKYAGFYIDDLLDQSNIRIALTHIDRKDDIRLPQAVKGFDLVVGGHDHVSKDEYCVLSAGVPVCETPAKGHYLGKIDLTYSNGSVKIEKTELIPVDKKAGKSKEVSALLKPYLSNVSELENKVIGTVDIDLTRSRDTKNLLKIPLVVYAAEAMKNFTGADVAFMNYTGARENIRKGKVLYNDIFKAFPFNNDVGTLKLTGEDIIKAIRISERGRIGSRKMPVVNWAGLEYDPADISGSIRINGQPIELSRKYTVATVDYLADGGSGFDILKKNGFTTTGKNIKEVIALRIRKRD